MKSSGWLCVEQLHFSWDGPLGPGARYTHTALSPFSAQSSGNNLEKWTGILYKMKHELSIISLVRVPTGTVNITFVSSLC